jgi:hypothetical protein
LIISPAILDSRIAEAQRISLDADSSGAFTPVRDTSTVIA